MRSRYQNALAVYGERDVRIGKRIDAFHARKRDFFLLFDRENARKISHALWYAAVIAGIPKNRPLFAADGFSRSLLRIFGFCTRLRPQLAVQNAFSDADALRRDL